MEGLPESVAHLLRGLRPAGLWYGALSTVVVLSVWCLHEKSSWEEWPAPIRCAMWTWLVATVAAVPYTHVVGAVTVWIERREINGLPVAPAPGAGTTGAPGANVPPGGAGTP